MGGQDGGLASCGLRECNRVPGGKHLDPKDRDIVS